MTRQATVEALCAVLEAALPKAERNEKWNAPNFSIGGRDLITLNLPPKGPVRVIFHRGAKARDTKTGDRLVSDDSARLMWATDQRAVAAFESPEDVALAAAWLKKFAKQWISAA
jgi:hypothetical protein